MFAAGVGWTAFVQRVALEKRIEAHDAWRLTRKCEHDVGRAIDGSDNARHRQRGICLLDVQQEFGLESVT